MGKFRLKGLNLTVDDVEICLFWAAGRTRVLSGTLFDLGALVSVQMDEANVVSKRCG